MRMLPIYVITEVLTIKRKMRHSVFCTCEFKVGNPGDVQTPGL